MKLARYLEEEEEELKVLIDLQASPQVKRREESNQTSRGKRNKERALRQSTEIC